MEREENLFLPTATTDIKIGKKSDNPFRAFLKFKAAVRAIFVDSEGVKKKREIRLAISCILVILSSVFLMNLETPRGLGVERAERKAAAPAAAPSEVRAVTRAQPEVKMTTLASAEATALSADLKGLVVPVLGVRPDQLRDSFNDSRSGGRVHQAIDILAAQDTPVLATADGTVMKLHTSARGGIMLYHSDATGQLVYYYGHLSRYADGIAEGKQVKKGDVIAYVGDTGNAGPGNFHLHFGVSRMAAPGKWSGGEPINPYPLLTAGR
jgi:murein DD-endopeptidase MepM/ murein hydrolase activator NlpD